MAVIALKRDVVLKTMSGGVSGLIPADAPAMVIHPIHYSRKEYREEYLASPEWKLKSAAILKRDPICTLCDSSPSCDAHHLTYERIHFERETDLIGVCRPCHNLIHHHAKLAKAKDFLSLKTQFNFLKKGGKFPKPKKRIFKRPAWGIFRYGQPRRGPLI